MPITLSSHQILHLRDAFELRGVAGSHDATWSRRAYAPQWIFTETMHSVREAIETAYPDHVIAFDVLFEAKPHVGVAWHCDYESLGPFDLPDVYVAMRDNHFLTLHFNLTDEGGALGTLQNPLWLSWLFYWVIVYTGIYSRLHRMLNRALSLCVSHGKVHPNTVGFGNVFNNMRLHCITPGTTRRISYVVRMVRRDMVTLSPSSLREGVSRSKDCRIFSSLTGCVPTRRKASDLDWAAALGR